MNPIGKLHTIQRGNIANIILAAQFQICCHLRIPIELVISLTN